MHDRAAKKVDARRGRERHAAREEGERKNRSEHEQRAKTERTTGQI
jgi:hypothetical protein